MSKKKDPKPNVYLSDRTMRIILDWCAWPWQEDTTVDDVVFMATAFMDMASIREKFWRDHFKGSDVEVDPKAIKRAIASER